MHAPQKTVAVIFIIFGLPSELTTIVPITLLLASILFSVSSTASAYMTKETFNMKPDLISVCLAESVST